MSRMRLDPENLRVESFAAAGPDELAGTVGQQGGGGSVRHSCGGRTCDTLVCACVVSQDVSNCICPTP